MTNQTLPGSNLPDLITSAVERRRAIQVTQARVQSSESSLRQQFTGFSASNSNQMRVEHPMIQTVHQEVPGVVQRLTEAVNKMHIERDAIMACRARRQEIQGRIATLKERRSFQIKLGLWLLILLVGFYILFKAMDKTAITSAEAEDAVEAANEAAMNQRLEAARNDAISSLSTIQHFSSQYFQNELASDCATWGEELAAIPPFLRGDWSEAGWKAHDFKHSWRLPFFVTGMAEERGSNYKVPILGPFLGSQTTIRIEGDSSQTVPMMHGVILQLAAAMPYGATFTLLDPAGAGRAFPMQRSLPFVRRIGADLYRDLEQVLEDITRLIQTYLDDQTSSFEQLPEQIQANERYEFIVAANFPDGYDRRTIEAMQRIAKNGPSAGKYMILQLADGKELPRDMDWDGFGSVCSFNTRKPPLFDSLPNCAVMPLHCPTGGAQSMVLELLGAAKPPETRIAWTDLAESDSTKWWKEDASHFAMAPVGASGRERTLDIWFGANRDGRPCTHGILGAMPGSGKSNLYHVLICGLAIRYSPDEVNLYLIDGKFGVEFQPYRRLPHTRAVALRSAPELSRSVLEELISEMKRRNDIFTSLNVFDLPGYRALGSPKGPLPRIIFLIDEYQELFEDDRMGHASACILKLAQQGRSAGVHMLLGSQRFGAVGMLHQTAIFGNIHLRMAMKMSQSDILGLTEFGRNGKRLIEQCDLPGKIVLNDQSGEDSKNEFGKVALLDSEQRVALLDALEAKAAAEWPAERRFATVVFDGQEQPNFSENPQVLDLIRLQQRPSVDAWRKIAAAPANEQGFGVPDWFAGERPMALWLGQELNVHGQARIVLRRRAMENVLLVGENQAALYGIIGAMLCAVPIAESSSAVRLFVVDRAVPGTPWQYLLPLIKDSLLTRIGCDVLFTDQARQGMAWLTEFASELERRAGLDESELVEQPTWLLTLAGADRLPTLAREPSKFGGLEETPDGEKLRRIYRDGPSLGLHLILSFPAAAPLKQCMERGQMDHFKHRVVTQMSEGDSFLVLGKDYAARLQRAETKPVFALYQDTIAGTETKFKPYTVDAQIAWIDQLEVLREHLNRWR